MTAGHDTFQNIHEGSPTQDPQENGTHDTMPQTRSQSIQVGFRRIGVVLSIAVLITGASLIFAPEILLNQPPGFKMIVYFVTVAVAIYTLFRAIGWIIAGFVGE